MEYIKYKENETTNISLERYMNMLEDINQYNTLKSIILRMFETNDEVLEIDKSDLNELILRSMSTMFTLSNLKNLKEIKLKM